MLMRLAAVGMVAGGIYALSGIHEPVRAAPAGLAGIGDTPGAVTEVGRRGGRGFARGGRSFGGRHFGGGRHFAGRRHFGGRGFRGGRHFYGGRHYGYRRNRGRNLFLYGALPFLGYQAYTGSYYGRSCGWLWRRYQATGSRYWHRRWARCRY
jgi:hypothetical protein